MRVRSAVLWFACASTLGCTRLPEPGPVQPEPADAGGSTQHDAIARGRHSFRSLRCANCHGADGRGDPSFPGAPILIGRTAEDLDHAVHDSCIDPFDLSCHPLKLPGTPLEVLADIAAYLSDLAGSSTAKPDPGPPCDDVPGSICTLAGNGVAGNRKGDGYLAREQYLFWPQDVTLDPQHRVIITDWNNYLIRRLETAGCVDGDCPLTNVIGAGELGDSCSTPAAPVASRNAQMNHPSGLWFTEAGNVILWGWHQWKVKYIPVAADGSYGEMYCLFGNGRGFSGDQLAAGLNLDGHGGPTRFNLPSSAVRDRRGNWYISDQGNIRIRIVRPDFSDVSESAGAQAFVSSLSDNIITTLGGGEPRTSTGDHARTLPDYSNSGDGGPVRDATFLVQFSFDAIPQMRMAIDDARDRLYVADSQNGRIRVIDLSRDPPVIDTFAGGGEDLVADHVPATRAKLSQPSDVDVIPDGSGDVLITDALNNCIRMVDFETKLIRTVAGQCGASTGGYEGDGGSALLAKLSEPGGAGAGPDRTLYIADTLNHRVRRVNAEPR